MTRRPAHLLSLLATGLCFAGGHSQAQTATDGANETGIVITVDPKLIKTGWLETNSKGQHQPLYAEVTVTVKNRSGQPCATSAEVVGTDAKLADASLVGTENAPDGQTLKLRIAGRQASGEKTKTFLRVEAKQDGAVKASTSVPIRVVVPATLALKSETVHDGPADPGLVHRVLNMTTIPKAAVRHPEAKLAAMCLHDLTLTVLDQFGEPLPALYEKAPVWAALGRSDYEPTHRALRKDSSFIDTLGLWQFVGEATNITVDPDRDRVQKFLAEPPPPCTPQQYAAYDPLVMQWSVGGHPIGTYQRQITLVDSGDPRKPNMKVTLVPTEPLPPEEPRIQFRDESGQ